MSRSASHPTRPAALSPVPSGSSRGIVRRSWLAVLVGIIVGILAGVVATLVLPKSYTAVSRVLVTSTGVETTTQNANGRTATAINLDTEAQLVTSAAVIQAAAETDPALGRQSYQHLVGSIAVTVPPNTTVLEIGYTAPTATAAQTGANAIASAYLSDRQTTAQGSLDGQITNTKESVSTLTDELETLTDALTATDSGARKAFYNSRIALVKSQITGENQQLVQLNGIQITPGRVVTAAGRPVRPSSPSRSITLASGFGVGLVLGVVVAWSLVRYRRRVGAPEDLVRLTDAPCLSVLPPAASKADSSPAVAAQLRRVALITMAMVDEPAIVVVSSPTASTSAGRVAAGLATSLSQSGTSAALLQVHDLDVSRPRGVSSARVHRADDLVSDSDESIPEALRRLRGHHAVLVVDAPGAVLDADAQTLAAHADAVLIVVDTGTSTRAVRQTVEEFDNVGAAVLGTVLTRRLTRGLTRNSRRRDDERDLESDLPRSTERPPERTDTKPVREATSSMPDNVSSDAKSNGKAKTAQDRSARTRT